MNKDLLIVYVDFEKEYNPVDGQTLFNILEDFGIDHKALFLIKQATTDMKSKVKFQSEISDSYGIKMGEEMDYLQFNYLLERVIREGVKQQERL